MSTRALELTGIRVMDASWQSPMLRSLNPKLNLDFIHPSREITVLWLRVKHDPINLKSNLAEIKGWIRQNEQLDKFLNLQYCHNLRGSFDLESVLPQNGQSVLALSWAHLFSHLSLIHAQFTAAKALRYMFEDRNFYNPANHDEICVAYNYPTRIGELGTYLEYVQKFLQSLIDGNPDTEFLTWIKQHIYIYDQWLASRHRPQS